MRSIFDKVSCFLPTCTIHYSAEMRRQGVEDRAVGPSTCRCFVIYTHHYLLYIRPPPFPFAFASWPHLAPTGSSHWYRRLFGSSPGIHC